MRNIKNLLAVFFAMVLVFGTVLSINISVCAEEEEEDGTFISGNYTYELEEGKAKITEYTGKETNISVPSTLDGYPVTAIGKNAYSDTGDSIIKSIYIPASITDIGEKAFAGCENLERITVDSKNPVYDSRNNCNAIIESGILILGCGNTKVPEGVTFIDEWAFARRSNVKRVELPYGVKVIGWAAFSGCDNLEEIIIPDTLTDFAYDSFCWCASLKSIKIPKGVEYIGRNTFMGCASLESIILPEGLTEIGRGAFWNCERLKEIYIPDSVTEIGNDNFNLTAYYNDPKNWEDGLLYCGKHLVGVSDSAESITIKPDTKAIAYDAFDNCKSLKSINIPDGIKTITGHFFEQTAYYNNDENWEDGLLYIGDYLAGAKKDWTGSFSIKPGTKTIGAEVFSQCKDVKEVTIPDSVTYIGDGAFSSCESLEKIIVDPNNKVYDSRDNCNAVIDTKSNTLLYGCIGTTIPGSVKTIAEYAFFGCAGLQYITIPDGVEVIGNMAFSDCSGLKGIAISSSVKEVTYNALNVFSPGLKVYGQEGSLAQEIFGDCEDIIFVVGDSSTMLEELKNELDITATPDKEKVDLTVNDTQAQPKRTFIIIIAIACAAIIATVVVLLVRRKHKLNAANNTD